MGKKYSIWMLGSIVVLMLSTNVQAASTFQLRCSSAEGATRWTESANGMSLWLTRRAVDADPDSTSGRRVLLRDYQIMVLHEQRLENDPNSVDGSWRTHSFRKIRITRADGGLFPDRMIGITKDRRAVDAAVFCEESGGPDLAKR